MTLPKLPFGRAGCLTPNELMRNYAEEVFHLTGRKIVNYAESFDGKGYAPPHGVFPVSSRSRRVGGEVI